MGHLVVDDRKGLPSPCSRSMGRGLGRREGTLPFPYAPAMMSHLDTDERPDVGKTTRRRDEEGVHRGEKSLSLCVSAMRKNGGSAYYLSLLGWQVITATFDRAASGIRVRHASDASTFWVRSDEQLVRDTPTA